LNFLNNLMPNTINLNFPISSKKEKPFMCFMSVSQYITFQFFPWLKFHKWINDFYYGISCPFCKSVFDVLVMNSLQFFLKAQKQFLKHSPKIVTITSNIKGYSKMFIVILLNLTKYIYRKLPFEEHHKIEKTITYEPWHFMIS